MKFVNAILRVITIIVLCITLLITLIIGIVVTLFEYAIEWFDDRRNDIAFKLNYGKRYK